MVEVKNSGVINMLAMEDKPFWTSTELNETQAQYFYVHINKNKALPADKATAFLVWPIRDF